MSLAVGEINNCSQNGACPTLTHEDTNILTSRASRRFVQEPLTSRRPHTESCCPPRNTAWVEPPPSMPPWDWKASRQRVVFLNTVQVTLACHASGLGRVLQDPIGMRARVLVPGMPGRGRTCLGVHKHTYPIPLPKSNQSLVDDLRPNRDLGQGLGMQGSCGSLSSRDNARKSFILQQKLGAPWRRQGASLRLRTTILRLCV